MEFYDKQRLEETNRGFADYVIKMQSSGGDIRSAVYRSQTTHHLKSMVEVATKYDKHKAIFSHLKIRLLQHSQSFFPVSIYQKLYPQLRKYNEQYKHLYKVTLDWCEGKIILDEKAKKRVVRTIKGDIIASE